MIFETKILLVTEEEPDDELSKLKGEDPDRGEQWVDFAFDFSTIVGVRKVCSMNGVVLHGQCAIYLRSSEYAVIILESYSKILKLYKELIDKRDFIAGLINSGDQLE
jgi:hypothetical protein